MAQRIKVILEDDLDGSEAAETVTFGLDGVTYEIDLSEDNAAQLREDVGSWVGHARRAGGRRAVGRRGPAAPRHSLSDVRSWARENGFQVSDRGRIPATVQAAYDKATR